MRVSISELGQKADGSKPWREAEKQVDTTLPMGIWKDGRAELFYGGYTILIGGVDQVHSSKTDSKCGWKERIISLYRIKCDVRVLILEVSVLKCL